MGVLQGSLALVLRRVVYVATLAGVAGLVIFHADAFGKILNASVSTFRKGVMLA